MPDPIRVAVADDQRVVRDGLQLLLDLVDGIECVGKAADGNEALQLIAAEHPDVLLLDLRMPVLDGLQTLQQLQGKANSPEVVVLTTFDDDDSVQSALAAGARGYLTKDASAADIERAVRDAASGRTTLDHTVQQRLVQLVTEGHGRKSPGPQPAPYGKLTARETEVLQLIANGNTNKEIAHRLTLSEATVKTHVNNLFAKLGVVDRAAAVAWAFRSGYVPH